MTVFTRTFKLDRAHLAQSAIVDAEGWTGSCPAIQFVGVPVPAPRPQGSAARAPALFGAAAMTKFKLTRTRFALLGPVEVEGHTGFWLLRKPVRYRVGVNCDQIRIQGEMLVVLQGIRRIAEAGYSPEALHGR